MNEEVEQIEVEAKRSWGVIIAWIGGITALAGFIGTVGGGVTWFRNHHRHNSEYAARMALAQSQTSQKQYQAALKTYDAILKEDPFDKPALDAQLDTAMLWVENFSVYVRQGKDEGDISAPALDEIFPVITSGLTKAKGARAADLQAHLGWAHFLNEKIASREDDSVALDNWHTALSIDPSNPYANAMLANWMLQTGGGELRDGIQHFHTAIETGRARPFVRELQTGGLLYLEKPGARAEMMKVSNEMRNQGEPLDAGHRHRIANWLFGQSGPDHGELAEALTAVSSDNAWKTYLWLAGETGDNSDMQDLHRMFIHAKLLELSGNRDGALGEYRGLQQKLRHQPGSLQDAVEAAIQRLHHA